MMVPCCALKRRQISISQCARGVERKRRRLVKEELRESSKRALHTYREPLKTVTLFKYMGRVLTAGDYDCPAVSVNLRKDRKSWTRMKRILIREGVDPKISGFFFEAVVHVVLLFGSDMWVLTPWVERALDSFQHRVMIRLTRRQTRRRG